MFLFVFGQEDLLFGESIDATDFCCTRTNHLWLYIVFVLWNVLCQCSGHLSRFAASCWWVVALVSVKWSSLSFLTGFGWQSVMSDTAPPACFLGVFAWAQPFLSFHPVVVRCMEAANGSCFVIQLTSLCLLIGQLRSLIGVGIERYVFMLVIVFILQC